MYIFSQNNVTRAAVSDVFVQQVARYEGIF